MGVNRALTHGQPHVRLSRGLLGQVHHAFGGDLRAMFTGGAFVDPSTLQFFYDLGIPVANGYGLTEACTVLTLNDLKPFRADTVGKPLPGVELRILNPEADGIGEVAVRSKTVMAHYLDDPELTAETIVDGWLLTGDLGKFDGDGHLQLFGRKKNMIVTEGGKNIYPEDIENAFDALPVKEYCIFAANYLWPAKSLGQEMLVLVVRLEANQELTDALAGSDERCQPAPARLQARGRISAMERGFSADRIHENQARGAGGRNRQKHQPRGRGCAVKQAYLAVVNPAAGGGRCRKLVGPALERLRAAGIELEVAETTGSGRGYGTGADRLPARLPQVHRGRRRRHLLRDREWSFSASPRRRDAHPGISSPGYGEFVPAGIHRPRRSLRHGSAGGGTHPALRCAAPRPSRTASSTTSIC